MLPPLGFCHRPIRCQSSCHQASPEPPRDGVLFWRLQSFPSQRWGLKENSAINLHVCAVHKRFVNTLSHIGSGRLSTGTAFALKYCLFSSSMSARGLEDNICSLHVHQTRPYQSHDIIELKRITYFSLLHYCENRWRKLPLQRYFDKHAVSQHRTDKIINWNRVRLWFFAQREGLSETHRCKRWICCLQVGEMKINARDDDSWLFGVAFLFKQKRRALPLPPGEVSFFDLERLCDGDPSGCGNYDNLRNSLQLSVLSSHLLNVGFNWFYHPRSQLNIIIL